MFSRFYRPALLNVSRNQRLFSSASSLHKASLTFFTKETCMLCTNAKTILYEVLESDSVKDKDLDLTVIDIMKPENEKWFDVYCYDVPVLHVDRPEQKKPVKFMHYFHHDKLTEEFQKD